MPQTFDAYGVAEIVFLQRAPGGLGNVGSVNSNACLSVAKRIAPKELHVCSKSPDGAGELRRSSTFAGIEPIEEIPGIVADPKFLQHRLILLAK